MCLPCAWAILAEFGQRLANLAAAISPAGEWKLHRKCEASGKKRECSKTQPPASTWTFRAYRFEAEANKSAFGACPRWRAKRHNRFLCLLHTRSQSRATTPPPQKQRTRTADDKQHVLARLGGSSQLVGARSKLIIGAFFFFKTRPNLVKFGPNLDVGQI